MFDIGIRMKQYEALHEDVMPDKPLVVRADGHRFSKLTRKCKKPYDDCFASIMKDTADAVLNENILFDFAYTQSDEITFVRLPKKDKTGNYIPHSMGGRNNKIATLISSMCGSWFTSFFQTAYGAKQESSVRAFFDARVINLPDIHEVTNCIYWRYLDCRRNSIAGLARYQLGHKACQGKSVKELEQLVSKNPDIPSTFYYGKFISNVHMVSYCELDKLTHEYRVKFIESLGVDVCPT